MQTGIKVGDVMKTFLITISAEKSIYDAACLMKEKKVGSVLIEKNGVITAIATQGDLVNKALAVKQLDLTIEKIASKPLVMISPEADLSEAAGLMGKKKIKRLLVGKERKVVGIISSTDIIRVSPSLYDLILSKHDLQ
ncbi:MAG: CBS domain-containing protein [Candidatus Micrarchaeota archaeon]